MLDQLIRFAQENLGDKISKENSLDPRQSADVFKTANDSLVDTLKSQAATGNFKGLLDLFNGKSDTSIDKNPIAGNVNQSVVKGLVDKLGLDEGKAGGIAAQIVPTLLNRFASKDTGTARNPSDLIKKIGLDGDSSINDALKNFGGKSGGITGLLKGLLGSK